MHSNLKYHGILTLLQRMTQVAFNHTKWLKRPFYYGKGNLFEREGTNSKKSYSKWCCLHSRTFYLMYVTSKNSETRVWNEIPNPECFFFSQVKWAEENLTLVLVKAADKEWIWVLNTRKWMFSWNEKWWFLTRGLSKWERSLRFISCSANLLWV